MEPFVERIRQQFLLHRLPPDSSVRWLVVGQVRWQVGAGCWHDGDNCGNPIIAHCCPRKCVSLDDDENHQRIGVCEYRGNADILERG